MNKKFLISWVVVFVLWMIGSMLIHDTWLGGDYEKLANMMRSEEDMMGLTHFMIIAHVLLAGAFVWIYQRGNEDKPWVAQGVRYGIAISVLGPIPWYMIYYVVQPTPGMLAVKQAIGDSVLVIVLALVVAFLNKPAEAAAPEATPSI